MKHWTKEEVKILCNKYPNEGVAGCKLLKRSSSSITWKAFTLGIKLSPHGKAKVYSKIHILKPDNEYKVNPRQFLKIKNPVTAYILGLLWADGYIRKTRKANRIELNMVEDDLKELLSIFKITGEWCVYSRNRPNRRRQLSILTNNRPLTDFLIQNDYTAKNEASANKILNLVPNYLKHYWFRGLIDGDGCFYYNIKTNQKQFSISSSLNQEWDFFTNLLDNLNIKYSIQKNNTYRGGDSRIRITNKAGIVKIGSYIYKNFLKDKIGLSRKYKKYLQIQNLK